MPIALPLIAMVALAANHATPAPRVIPIQVEAGRFYATPETVDGHTLRMLVDTGGGGGSGLYWLSAASVKRLDLAESACTLGDDTLNVAKLPRFKPARGLPLPDSPCGPVALVNRQSRPSPTYDDGQLGAGYLPGRIWTFDYAARRLTMEGSGWRPDPAAHAALLGFPHDTEGGKATGFPRITIQVDCRPLDMLLDTGATAHPTPAGAKASGTPTVNGYGAASYITTSVLERWHRAHPDWRVVAKGDDLSGAEHATRLIEVPKVRIAGWSVGPVWFTERPDRTFHEFMSSMMDKRVEGAVGGNVLGHFAMTVDYPGEKAWFRCADGCVEAK